jgi:hypothetical protein
MNDVQKANVTRLIEHYKALPGLTNWGYGQCAARILQDMFIIDDKFADHQVAEALGIDYNDAIGLIAGPGDYFLRKLSDAERRDLVVTTLEGILAEGNVDWGPPKI